MTSRSRLMPLADMVDGQEADVFAMLAQRELKETREGKPFWRVSFRDARREISFPIWNDSTWFSACENDWKAGSFYKLRCVYRDTSHGAVLEIRKIRETAASDAADGFDAWMLVPRTQRDESEMFADLLAIASQQIRDSHLAALVVGILAEHQELLCTLSAAVYHHHAFRGGFVEHILSVARNAVFLAEKYHHWLPETVDGRVRDLVIAGAILHDIGKLRELKMVSTGAELTPAGELIGHALLGRDLVREAAQRHPIDAETLLRLEHLIVAHQRTPEWGAPKPPMTPEAWLVYYADDIDARMQMLHEAMLAEPGQWITSNKNAIKQKVFKGPLPEDG